MAKRDFLTAEASTKATEAAAPAPEADAPKRKLRDELYNYMEENDAAVESLRIRIAKLERALTNLLSKGILASAEEDAAGDVCKILAGEDIETEDRPPKNGPGYGWMFGLANGNGFTSDKKEAEKLREAGFDTHGIFVMFVDGEPDRELTDEEIEELLAKKL